MEKDEKRKVPDFSTPIKTHEIIIACAYLFAHTLLVPMLIDRVNISLSLGLSDAELTFWTYAFSCVFLTIFLFGFLKESFSDLCDNIGKTVTGIILCYAGNYALTVIVTYLIVSIPGFSVNPNEAVLNDAVFTGTGFIKAAAFITGPIVEEVIFRGAIFGGIRKKNRFAAYAVSMLIFAFYHLFSEIILDPSLENFIYLIEYLPGGFMLARCYEKSRNVWGPIFLHMLINIVSISVKLM